MIADQRQTSNSARTDAEGLTLHVRLRDVRVPGWETRSVALRDHQRSTQAAYDADATGWTSRTTPRQLELAEQLRAESDGLIIDLGCGPGWHLPILEPAVGVDLSIEMARLATEYGPVVQSDLGRLPFARESIGGVWASRSLVHFPRTEVPMALAELHRAMQIGAMGYIWLFEGDDEARQWDNDSLPGRTFSLLAACVAAAHTRWCRIRCW